MSLKRFKADSLKDKLEAKEALGAVKVEKKEIKKESKKK